MRIKDNRFLIDGQPIPVPDEGVELELTDLDSGDSGRDEAGYMHRIVLRRRVRTWGLRYGSLSREDHAYLLDLLADKDTFTLTWEDETGALRQSKCYCAAIQAALYNRLTGLYKNVKLSIVEC